jgi:hypothetical protein
MGGAQEPAYLAFLCIGAYIAVLVGAFALARRWPLVTRSALATAAVVGVAFLAWAWIGGISALPGKLVGPADAQFAFHLGFPLTVFGTAVFMVCCAPSPPRFNDGTTKSLVAEFMCRILVTYILTAIIGIITYTGVTGYSK